MAEDIMQMQRQAAQRVSRMQEHSRRVFEEHRGQFAAPSAPPRGTQAAGFTQPTMRSTGLYSRPTLSAQTNDTCPPTACEPCEANTIEAARLAHRSLFDGEQWLLIGLALLLFRSGCRPELAIALLYLAM